MQRHLDGNDAGAGLVAAEEWLHNPYPYKDLVEFAPDAWLLVDPDKSIRLLNTRAERLFGYSRVSLIGRKIDTLMAAPGTPEGADSGSGKMDQVLREIGSTFEMIGQRSNRSRFPIEVSISPIQIKQTAYIVVSVRDITDRKISEGKIRTSENRYRRLFESAQDGILILDEDSGQIADVNPYLLALLGYPYDYFIGKRLWELGAFKDIPESRAAFQELQDNNYVRYENLPLQSCNGRMIDVEFVSNVYLANSTKVIQCNIRDVSKRKTEEQTLRHKLAQLESSNHDLENFAVMAAHDIREPLLGIIGMSELLQNRCCDMLDAQGKEFLDLTLRNARHLQALLADLLDLARMGRQESVNNIVDCEAELATVKLQLNTLIVEHNARITHDSLPRLRGNEYEFNRLLQNLISNAIKFQPGHRPVVHISCRREGGYWQFSVRDQGIGIPPEHLQSIFQTLRRLHSNDEYEGSGIGLALCDKIVRQQGGKIWAESVVGKGSTFYFSLKAE